MASGIPFVPLDCQLDEKFEYIEAEFGITGFAVVVKLFQRIYGGHGYYCEWNDRVALLFAKREGVGGNVVREIVSAAIKERIFDEGLFQKYGILTSAGIQRRFSEVAKRRKQIFDKPEYVLHRRDDFSENADISSENVNISSENADICETSKVNVSKVNESKESKAEPRSAPDSEITRADLVGRYGEQAVSKYEQRFESWREKRGAVVRNRWEIISKWLSEDGVQPAQNASSFDVDEVVESIKSKYRGGQIDG